MPRQIAGPPVGKVEFIPNVELRGGWINREEDEPIKIELNAPTEADLRAFLVEHKNISMGDLYDALIVAYAEKVSNYIGRAGPIVTGEDLKTHGEFDVICATGLYLMGVTDEEKKTSEQP